MLDEDTQRIGNFLLSQGYKSMGEWAIENGFGYNKYHDSWHNEEGQYVDLEETILELIDGN